MRGKCKFWWVVIIFCFNIPAFGQETFALITYYPAPFGIYQRLVTQTLGVGDMNNNGIGADDVPDPIANPGDVWIAGDVGIGTTTPQSTLSVAGSAAIGTNYAANTAAPANSLLVEGGMGVGVVTSPLNGDLEINGTLSLVPVLAPQAKSGQAQDLEGTIYYSNADGDKGLKFHNGTTWKKVGGGVTLGPEQVVDSVTFITASDQLRYTGKVQYDPPVIISALCPPGSVVTGAKMKGANKCPHGCGLLGGGAFDDVDRLSRVSVICRQLQ